MRRAGPTSLGTSESQDGYIESKEPKAYKGYQSCIARVLAGVHLFAQTSVSLLGMAEGARQQSSRDCLCNCGRFKDLRQSLLESKIRHESLIGLSDLCASAHPGLTSTIILHCYLQNHDAWKPSPPVPDQAALLQGRPFHSPRRPQPIVTTARTDTARGETAGEPGGESHCKEGRGYYEYE